MRTLDNIRQLINKETHNENESKKMAVLIRVLCLAVIAYFCLDIFVFALWGEVLFLGLSMLLGILFFAVLAASYTASKNVTVWSFLGVTAVWGIMLTILFGRDSGAQVFPIFLILIFFFASYASFYMKLLFGLVISIIFIYCNERMGSLGLMMNTDIGVRMYVRGSLMPVMILCTSIATYMFSRDSQSLEKKLIEYNKKLKEKANTDPLTGLNNRGMAMEYLEGFAKKADEMICSICICDIDHFKRVNDSYGHDIGDLVLKAVAKVLMTCTADKGFVARWGGEEFFIAFPGKNGDEAMETLYNIQSELHKTVVMSGDQKIRVTLTYGLTEYDRSLPLDQNIKEADNKLYTGKEGGRDRIVY